MHQKQFERLLKVSDFPARETIFGGRAAGRKCRSDALRKCLSDESFRSVCSTEQRSGMVHLSKSYFVKNFMKKNYNYTRPKLHLPEYGRHIQEMVETLIEIEDRDERTRQAKAVIAVMGNLNPLLRDTADFTHKLWDHLIIMSDFRLDVDSPYSLPSRADLLVEPRRMEYPQSYISHKHYGKYVARMLRSLADEKNPESVGLAVDNIARYMRAKSFEYNQEHPNNEVIIKDIKKLSGDAIEVDEVALNNLRSDYKQHFSARPQNGRNGGKQGVRKGTQVRGGKTQSRSAHGQRQPKNGGKHN